MQALNLYSHSPDDVVARIGQHREAVPRLADVVIIGGGIIGTASAYYLAKRGLSVVVTEKDKIASQQSGRNWGFVRTQYRDPAELPLAVEALLLWPLLERELGLEIGWRRGGCLFVAKNDAECAELARWQSNTRDVAKDARMLSGREVEALMPALGARVPGALYTHSDGQAEPGLATTAFARAAEQAGARILEDCGALAIETAGGAVEGVATEHGLIRAKMVVCAAGATSHRLLAGLNLSLPQQIVRNTVSLTSPTASLSQACFCGLGLGLRQRADGSCILAAESTSDIDLTLDSIRAAQFFLPGLLPNRKTFALNLGRPFLEELYRRLLLKDSERAIEPRRPRILPNLKRATETVALFQSLFEDVGPVSVRKSWAGYIDVLPDALPVIDRIAAVPGLIVATGFSGHGFGLAPAVGRNVAMLASGAQPVVALEPFRFDRFARGTYGRPHAPL
jgi:glycine/D-amino acid oxidase-like deaminating enzyme